MKTDSTDSKGAEHAPSHAPPASSPLRLIVLLSVLVVVVGALLYDWVIAPPRVLAAYDRVLDTVTKHNEFGLTAAGKAALKKSEIDAGDGSGMIYSEDIQKIIGMAPTKVEKSKRYTIEHYCWWGWIPRKSNYITVLYVGNQDKPHYSTHYANEMPEDDAIPGKKIGPPPVDLTSEGNREEIKVFSAGAPTGVGPAGRGGPAMGPPGGGGGKGKGKGGRPQAKANAEDGEPKGDGEGPKKPDDSSTKTDEGSKKAEDSPKKTDEPKAKDEPVKEAAKEAK